jgi:uncharacterized damage-inducible protein DinB
MVSSDVLLILIRDLNKLEEELSQYKREEDIWKMVPGTSNSAGNLALHLTGNLRHFIGGVLGKTGYVRQRDYEFSSKAESIEDLKIIISKCREEISAALTNFETELLEEDFPLEMSGQVRTTGYILTHLAVHFGYHLGQLNFHRRYFSEIS